MKFVRIIEGYDHLWAVKASDKKFDELTDLFEKWTNFGYLLNFFTSNIEDLRSYFHIEKVSEAIKDTLEDVEDLEELIFEFPYTENLDSLFHPLSLQDSRASELTREKARNWDRARHVSWLRVYAIRLEPNVFIVTGGAIKLHRAMPEREHTAIELAKLDRCKSYLKANGVFDKDSFVELINEEEYEE